MCKKITIFTITLITLTSLFAITASASTLHTFKSNYDADKYTTAQINYNIPLKISQDWYPLKDVSKYLPIEVSWDNKTREVVIRSENSIQLLNYSNSSTKTEKRYKSNKLPSTMLKIENGVTYCSPKFLTSLLGGVGFMYDGEVYYFDGESVSSRLISPGRSEKFKSNVITSMYQMKVKMPDEYKFVRKCITGGISCVEKGSDKNVPNSALGYTYPSVYKPCCYVVGDKLTGTNLASLIAHESYHVYQYKSGKSVGEDGANKYENMIKQTLISMN